MKLFINISASYSFLYIYLINFIVLLWDAMQYICLRFSMTGEFVERAFYLQEGLSHKRFPPFSNHEICYQSKHFSRYYVSIITIGMYNDASNVKSAKLIVNVLLWILPLSSIINMITINFIKYLKIIVISSISYPI